MKFGGPEFSRSLLFCYYVAVTLCYAVLCVPSLLDIEVEVSETQQRSLDGTLKCESV